uniref:ACB domain-containing protein n=1 Tax=Xiphophorus couchianus TaxID=32473 RepID=A0A3B5LJE6_9TELE
MAQQEKEEEEKDEYSLEAKFTAAVKVIRSLPEEGPFQPSDDIMLRFYSYYRQATMGPCHIPRPTGFWDTGGKAKWDAWSSLGNMTKEEAMKNYIEHIQLILETIPISEEVTELVQRLGNFYTEVDGEEDEEGNGAVRRPFTRPFAEHADIVKCSCFFFFVVVVFLTPDWDQDPRFLTVEDRRWRSETKGSNSSLEPSVSSFTNGTHSSLNSEVEEEELACSMEPTGLHNPYLHFNGYFNGSPGATCIPLRCVSADAACRHPVVATRGNTNEQIAAALRRLQHNMADVLHRLHALEELTRSQVINQNRRLLYLLQRHPDLFCLCHIFAHLVYRHQSAYTKRSLYFLIFSQDLRLQERKASYLFHERFLSFLFSSHCSHSYYYSSKEWTSMVYTVYICL